MKLIKYIIENVYTHALLTPTRPTYQTTIRHIHPNTHAHHRLTTHRPHIPYIQIATPISLIPLDPTFSIMLYENYYRYSYRINLP